MARSGPTLGTVLRKKRRGKEITQEQLAELVGVDPTLVSQWETGKRIPPVARLVLLAGILDLDSDTLLQMRARYDEAKLDERRRLIPKRMRDAASQAREAPESLVRETSARYGQGWRKTQEDLARLSVDLEKLPRRIRVEILRSLRRQVDAALAEQDDDKARDR